MSNSSLVTDLVLADIHNYTKGRTVPITEIVIHHMAGKCTAAKCGQIFQNPYRNGSAHYGIGYDGSVGLYVEECNTAWANSNWASNKRAVSIETSNSSIGGNWPVSDVTLNKLIQLVADIAKRNNLGTLVLGENLRWHSYYAATACPGPYLKSKLQYICDEANKINFPPQQEEEEEEVTYYEKPKDFPEQYQREAAQDFMKRGIIKGDEKGNIHMSIDMLRILMMADRMK